jgi:hypothetical protein
MFVWKRMGVCDEKYLILSSYLLIKAKCTSKQSSAYCLQLDLYLIISEVKDSLL